MRKLALMMTMALAGVAGGAQGETRVPDSEIEIKLSYAPVVKYGWCGARSCSHHLRQGVGCELSE